MSIAAYDFRKMIQIAAPLAAALAALSAAHASSQAPAGTDAAETGHMLVIPASDGYGFDDCLSANKDCGHVIADAWCEAHGLSASISFGRAEDITASIAQPAASGKPANVGPGAIVVNCKG